MTPLQAAECAVEDGREALAALHELVREAMSMVAEARAAELAAVQRAGEARARADKLAQILTGAAGLADEVLRESGRDEDHAYELARQVADAIAAL